MAKMNWSRAAESKRVWAYSGIFHKVPVSSAMQVARKKVAICRDDLDNAKRNGASKEAIAVKQRRLAAARTTYYRLRP